MKFPDVHGLLIPPDADPSSFFLSTLTEVGSVNLALALSIDSTSAHLLQEIRKATHGLLILNAIFFEKDTLRFLRVDEEERLLKEWGLPLRWLRFENKEKDPLMEPGNTCPPSLLSPLLVMNGVSWLLATDPKVLSWLRHVEDIRPESLPGWIAPVIQSLRSSDLKKDR